MNVIKVLCVTGFQATAVTIHVQQWQIIIIFFSKSSQTLHNETSADEVSRKFMRWFLSKSKIGMIGTTVNKANNLHKAKYFKPKAQWKKKLYPYRSQSGGYWKNAILTMHNTMLTEHGTQCKRMEKTCMY